MKEWDDAKEFEERADFIANEDLISWTVQNDFFTGVQKKILQTGAKLIVGPRGTGKTHQMKFAYHDCLDDKNKPLAVYVSLNKYYHLEPLLSKQSNAITIFHTWVLSKILLGCYGLLEHLNSDIELYENKSILSQKSLKNFCTDIEKSTDIVIEKGTGVVQEWHNNVIAKVTIEETINAIEKLTLELGRKRAILLLDDAALTLTPEYLIEFFEVFRSLKTSHIAPKASVYPGTTVYGPRFHVGHDAEPVSSWLNFIDNENYSQFMDDLIEQRSLRDTKTINNDVIEIFKYAAFGIPRHFINLLRNYIQSQSKSSQQRFNSVIEKQAEFIKGEYSSLKIKLPQYRNIIETGWRLHEQIVQIITAENKKNIQDDERQLQFSILKEPNLKQDRMFQFLIEAGLLYEIEAHKEGFHPDGSNKEYNRYVPHLLFLVQSRAFSTGKGFNAKEVIEFIKRRDKKHSIRREFSNLLKDKDKGLNLNLPPCQNCHTERLTEQQNFCHNCGKELIRQSNFDSCMKVEINELPFLTPLTKQIIQEATLHTIGDFLLTSNPATKLRKAKGIGRVRAERIYEQVMNRIEEFLS